MKRNLALLRILGVSLALALSPAAVLAQTTTGTGAGLGSGTAGGTGGGTTTGAGTTGGAAGSGSGTTAQAVGAVTSLTQTASIYSAGSGAGSATTIPSNSNFMANSYVIPQSLGLPSLYSTQYGAQNTISASGGPKGKFTYLYVAKPTAAAAAKAAATTAVGFNTYNVPRSPVYQTSLSDRIPMRRHEPATVYPKVRQVIENSSRFRDKIQVNLDGDTFVLTGVVGNEDDRRVAEGTIRMTPGVYNVRNDLQVIRN